jgi:hypothetical protein
MMKSNGRMSPRTGKEAAAREAGSELARASSKKLQTYRPRTSSEKEVDWEVPPIFMMIVLIQNKLPNPSVCVCG